MEVTRKFLLPQSNLTNQLSGRDLSVVRGPLFFVRCHLSLVRCNGIANSPIPAGRTVHRNREPSESNKSDNNTSISKSQWDARNQTKRKQKDKGQRTKDKGQRTKDKGQRTKDKGQRTKDKGQRTKDKGQRTKDNGQRTNGQRTTDNGQRTNSLFRRPLCGRCVLVSR